MFRSFCIPILFDICSKRKCRFLWQLLLLIHLSIIGSSAQAQSSQGTITLASGSFIINMGVNDKTKPAGLKPYGMVYDLLKNYNVPVYWIINPGKVKDGVDFSYNGVAYRGGTFVIDKKYINTTVANVISQWTGSVVVNGKGLVVGAYTTSSLNIKPAYRFTHAPKWTLDPDRGDMIEAYFTNAGIPATAYSMQYPANLNTCDEIFVLPHGDPEWSTHGALYNWNLTYKGAIWVACHAGSALANMYNPSNISEQTNFLSTKRNTTGTAGDPVAGKTDYAENSLVLWTHHNDGSAPFNTLTGTVPGGTLATAADPVAQFIGIPDAAVQNGSEQIYLPVPGQSWLPTTKIITFDPTHKDIPSKSPGPAVTLAYGRGFGDPNRGLVMYEGGHIHDKGTTDDVAAQRAFFNFSLLITLDKIPLINSIAGIPSNGNIEATQTFNFTANTTFQVPPISPTYTWSLTRADNGAAIGSFSTNGTGSASTTTYIPPTGVTQNIPAKLTLVVNGGCGRETFETYDVTITPGPRPPVATADNASISTSCYKVGQNMVVSVLNNDSDPDGDAMTVTSVSGNNGTWITNGNTVTYTPTSNFFGVATGNYTVCDPGGLCAGSTIVIGVGEADANGCFPGSVYDVVSTVPANSGTGVTNAVNAKGSPDYDPADAGTYTVVSGTTNMLTLDFGSLYAANTDKKVVVYFASSIQGNSVSMQVEGSTDKITYTTLGTVSTSDKDGAAAGRFSLPGAGLRYIRISRPGGATAGTDLLVDAAEIENYGCIAAALVAANDALTINEEIPATINVVQNDNNPGNLDLTIEITQFPSKGKISQNPDNTFTYVNNVDATGADLFRYRVCNSENVCSEATVNVTIVDDQCSPDNLYKAISTSAPIVKTFSLTTEADETYIRQDGGAANTNYGVKDIAEIGKRPNNSRRFLWKSVGFTTAIPAGAIIQSANFSIAQEGGESSTMSLSVYPVTQSWVELEATWNKQQTGGNWTTAGGTYSNTPVNTQTVTRTGNSDNGKRTTFDVTSLVQNWQDNRSATSPRPDETGFLIKQTNESLIDKKIFFGTSENTTTGYQPILTVTYTVLNATCAAIPNRNPLANPDYVTTNSITPLSIAVLANDADTDLPAQSLSISNPQISVTAGAGSATIDPANSSKILFTPNPAYTGTAVIRYQISDGNLSDESFIYVTVKATDPVSKRDNITTNSGSAVSANIAANDTNPSGYTLADPLILKNPSNGAVTFSGTTLTYTPAPDFYGTDTIVYQVCTIPNPNVCNQVSLCDTALVVVKVNNRPPVAVNDNVNTNRCQAVTIKVLNNDVDPEHGILSVSVSQNPANGIVVLSGNDIIYTPNAGYTGAFDQFTYQVCDNATPSLCATATVYVGIYATPVNLVPVAVNDTADGSGDEIIYIDVLTNDRDPDNNNLEVSYPPSGLQAAHGRVVVLSNGLIEYTPDQGFAGIDAFDYTLCDVVDVPSGCVPIPSQCVTARVSVTVIGLNNALYTTTSATNKDVFVNGFIVASVYDADGPVVSAVLVNNTSLPPGMSLNSTNGTITVSNQAAIAAGTYTFQIRTTDASTGTTVSQLSVTVVNDNEAVYSAIANRNWYDNANGSVLATVRDTDGAIVNATLGSSNFPAGAVALNSTSGEVTVLERGLLLPGTFNMTITTTDDQGGITNQTISIVFTGDRDSDGVTDFADIDGNNDGITKTSAYQGADALADHDGDGVLNFADQQYNLSVSSSWRDQNLDGINDFFDTDLDGIINDFDLDSDGDGMLNAVEANNGKVPPNFSTTTGQYGGLVSANGMPVSAQTGSNNGISVLTQPDNDADGKADFLDLDSDSDGITDNLEAQPWPGYIPLSGADDNRNGIDNAYDVAVGGNTIIPVDFDEDNLSEYLDRDSDDDTSADWIEAFDNNGNGYSMDDLIARASAYTGPESGFYDNNLDTDADGTPDWLEDDNKNGIPNFLDHTSLYYRDSNFNGLVNLLDQNSSGSLAAPPDNNANGMQDYRDSYLITPLPVTLIRFTGAPENNKVLLRWETVQEINCEQFIVERSQNGRTFNEIGKVAGNGTTQDAHRYSFTDIKPLKGVNHYRLRIVDKDGSRDYSQLIAVNMVFKPMVSVYPNPFAEQIHLKMTAPAKETVMLKVLDIRGAEILSQQLQVTEGNNLFAIPLEEMASGAYLFTITGQQIFYQQQIVKK